MKPNLTLSLVVLAIALLGCGQPSAPAPVLLDISSTATEDFKDIAFVIEEIDRLGDGSHRVLAAGDYSGNRVALAVAVASGMNPGVVGSIIDSSAFLEAGITFESVGSDSDALLAAIADLYSCTMPSSQMRPEIEFVAFPLEGDPKNIESEHLNFKIFHDPDNLNGEYCELFVHVDLPNRSLEIHEKDREYRTNVVKALAQP